MLRRNFIRTTLTALLAPRLLLAQQVSKPPAPPPPAPVPWELGLNRKTPQPHTEVADAVAETDGSFFTALQMATLVHLSATLLPAMRDKPGAVEAETPSFLDFLIGSSAERRQKVYKDGLDWLEAESRKQYSKPFAALDEQQTGTLLEPWLRPWMNDHPPTEPHADFLNIAHDDIRTATFNSKAWIDGRPKAEAQNARSNEEAGTELYWYPIEPDLPLSLANRNTGLPHVVAAPKSSNTMPAYQR